MFFSVYHACVGWSLKDKRQGNSQLAMLRQNKNNQQPNHIKNIFRPLYNKSIFTNQRNHLNKLFVTFILLMFSIYGELNAQWVQTKGPYGGSLRTLAVDSPFVYAGGDYAGVYKSSDNGFSWARINTGLTSLRVMSLIKVSGVLIAGTDVGGYFVSTDNGTNWSQANNGLPSPSITVGFCLAACGDTVFAGTSSGIFMTTDFGANWSPRNNGILALGISSILINDSDMFASTNGGVYYSNNRGVSWIDKSAELNGNGVSALVIKDTCYLRHRITILFSFLKIKAILGHQGLHIRCPAII